MRKQSKTFFVTGTDTGVGKSVVSAAILHDANEMGLTTLGLKPIAAGCDDTEDGLRNEDAVLLRRYSSIDVPYEMSNPISLSLAIAPHIAAEQEGRSINLARLEGMCKGALMQRPDLALIEGAGGWRVPINARHTLADLAKALNVPVILVVGLRLWCINHALLSAEAIRADGLAIAGWVINQVEPDMPYAEANIDSLRQRIPEPYLGAIPHSGQSVSVPELAQYIDINVLL